MDTEGLDEELGARLVLGPSPAKKSNVLCALSFRCVSDINRENMRVFCSYSGRCALNYVLCAHLSSTISKHYMQFLLYSQRGI